jgi:hypothetical protein
MKQQLSTSSRISELRKEIDAITQVPKANLETAAKTAVALVACWPGQQSPDPMVAKAYMRQMGELLVGQDLDVLQKLLGEFVRHHEFLPTIAKVADFIDSRMEPKRARIGFYLDEIASLERAAEERAVPAEERERRANMLRETAKVIRDTARAKSMERANMPPPIQCHSAELLLTALNNLQDINTGGGE